MTLPIKSNFDPPYSTLIQNVYTTQTANTHLQSQSKYFVARFDNRITINHYGVKGLSENEKKYDHVVYGQPPKKNIIFVSNKRILVSHQRKHSITISVSALYTNRSPKLSSMYYIISTNIHIVRISVINAYTQPFARIRPCTIPCTVTDVTLRSPSLKFSCLLNRK